MSTQLVNLDAMIQREDLEETSGGSAPRQSIREIRVDDLEQGRPLFATLRKPDFQRVTANWSSEKVADFIRTFLNSEFVPSLVMWESTLSGKFFVIDGAHRLSALMAWVNNDYGNGTISKKFFGEEGISEAQKRYAKATSALIDEIGTYADLKVYAQNPDQAPNEKTRVLARKLFTSKLDLQPVGGGAQTAEKSFFKINMSATIIDDTELAILKARRKPNAIATRALMHAGRGHKFWMAFPPDGQEQIESLANEIHEVLFKPIIEDPITTTDLPVAGNSYGPQSFQLLLDLVNMANSITPAMWIEPKRPPKKRSQPVPLLADDEDGTSTIAFLRRVRESAWLVSGKQSKSLGLHPVVYFYGANGKFQPAALLSAVKYFEKREKDNTLEEFLYHRRDFEEFLIRHRHFINQLGHSKGSRTRPVDSIVALYEIVFSETKSGKRGEEIVAELLRDERLKGLEDISENDPKYRRRFTKDVKSAAYLRDSIDSPINCRICKARLHSKSMSPDHIKDLKDSGSGNPQNLQWTHYYCNSMKDKLRW